MLRTDYNPSITYVHLFFISLRFLVCLRYIVVIFVQAISNHKTMQMLSRYVNLNADKPSQEIRLISFDTKPKEQ